MSGSSIGETNLAGPSRDCVMGVVHSIIFPEPILAPGEVFGGANDYEVQLRRCGLCVS